MTTIHVTASRDYDVLVQPGLLDDAGAQIARVLGTGRTAAIVAGETVAGLYAGRLAASLTRAGFRAVTFTYPGGEHCKTLATYAALLDFLAAHRLSRSDLIVALGGGVTGDLAGFAAATYQRGIPFVQVPTTLLAAVDSSVGGKTAVNLASGKNQVGCFYQPSLVLCDPDTLRTLPPRQISAGLAESVKMALTSDADLLDRIERSADLTAGLPEIIARSLTIKKNVVEQDPHEHGLRRVLNFGHTVGHAIESSAGGRLLHGECVALGMLPMCAPALRPRLIRVLRKCGLPTEIETTREALLPYLRHDKKGQGAAVTAVEVDEPGSFRFTTMMPEEILHRLEGVLL